LSFSDFFRKADYSQYNFIYHFSIFESANYLKMERMKWTDRKFSFNIPAGWMFNILERLSGTAIRIKELTKILTVTQLEIQPEGKWSIKEHIGHLTDLEDLHEGRLDDFVFRTEILRPADMDNVKTEDANHNENTIQHLISDFSIKRNRLIRRFHKLDNLTQQFESMHPRLKVLMKPVDMAFFIAEHDDHHLASMREIVNAM
jgi:hypothetical protein